MCVFFFGHLYSFIIPVGKQFYLFFFCFVFFVFFNAKKNCHNEIYAAQSKKCLLLIMPILKQPQVDQNCLEKVKVLPCIIPACAPITQVILQIAIALATPLFLSFVIQTTSDLQEAFWIATLHFMVIFQRWWIWFSL